MQTTLRTKLPTVYVLTNDYHTVFYTGVTGYPFDRIPLHVEGRGCYVTSKYRTTKLVYFEYHVSMTKALEREKQVKRWNREWKMNLIRTINPDMRNLANCFLPF